MGNESAWVIHVAGGS